MPTKVETVEIQWQAKIDDWKKKVESMPGISDKAAKQMSKSLIDEMNKAKKQTAAEMGSLADKVKASGGRIGKVAELIGGQWGTALRSIKGGGELASEGLGAVAVGAIGIGLAVGGVAKLGMAVGNVLTNLDQYKDRIESLQGRGILSAADVVGMQRASAAMEEAKGRLSDIAVITASKVAPAIEGFILGAVYSFKLLGTLAGETLHDITEALSATANAWASGFSDKASRRATRALADLTDQSGEWELATATATSAAQDLWTTIGENAGKVDEKTKQSTKSIKENQAAWVTAALQRLEIEDLLNAEAAAGVAADEERTASDKALSASMTESFTSQVTHTENLGDAMKKYLVTSKATYDTDVASAKVAAEAKRAIVVQQMSDMSMGLAYASQINGSLSAMSDELMQRQVDNAKQGSKAQKKALHDQAVAHKATAIIQATIDTAAASVGTLGAIPGPAGIALAVVEAALGAASIGVIASQQIPSAHTGDLVRPQGYANDEVRIRAQVGEGILSRQAMKRIGGEAGLNTLNNSPSSVGGSMPVINILDHHSFNGQANRSLGRRDSAFARVQRLAVNASRSAGHRSFKY